MSKFAFPKGQGDVSPRAPHSNPVAGTCGQRRAHATPRTEFVDANDVARVWYSHPPLPLSASPRVALHCRCLAGVELGLRLSVRGTGRSALRTSASYLATALSPARTCSRITERLCDLCMPRNCPLPSRTRTRFGLDQVPAALVVGSLAPGTSFSRRRATLPLGHTLTAAVCGGCARSRAWS